MIQGLYREVKLDMMLSITDGYSKDLPYRDRFDLLWINSIRHVISHPDQAKFLERFEASSYLEPTLPDAVMAEIEQIMGFYSDGVAEGGVQGSPCLGSPRLVDWGGRLARETASRRGVGA